MIRRLLCLICLLCVFPGIDYAAGRVSRHGTTRGRSAYSVKRSRRTRAYSPRVPKARSARCWYCQRDRSGRIRRSSSARTAFRKSHPCPSTLRTRGACPGYVIDHIRPLKRGGPDSPSNMQWQTVQAAKAKDRVE